MFENKQHKEMCIYHLRSYYVYALFFLLVEKREANHLM